MDCPQWHDDHEMRAPLVFDRENGVVEKAEKDAVSSNLDRQMIEGWHEQWFAGVVPVPYYAGNCRGNEPEKPCLAQNVAVVNTVTGERLPGTPFGSVRSTLDKVLDQANRSLSKAVDQAETTERVRAIATSIGFAIADFIRVHPFINGNGRVSRLLWRALLAKAGLPARWGVATRPAGPYSEAMKAAMLGKKSKCIALVLAGIANQGGAAARVTSGASGVAGTKNPA